MQKDIYIKKRTDTKNIQNTLRSNKSPFKFYFHIQATNLHFVRVHSIENIFFFFHFCSPLLFGLIIFIIFICIFTLNRQIPITRKYSSKCKFFSLFPHFISRSCSFPFLRSFCFYVESLNFVKTHFL